MNLLYTPIDIQTPKINEDLLQFYMDKNAKLHYTGLWYYWTICAKNIYESSIEEYNANWNNRYNSKVSVEWHPNISNVSNVKSTLQLLPYEKITHVNILRQIKDVPLHYDVHEYENSIPNQMCYKWLVISNSFDSFYVEPKQYIKLPNKNKIFAIKESQVKHGATLSDPKKLIISIFGLYNDKHNALIRKSQEKFKDYAITG